MPKDGYKRFGRKHMMDMAKVIRNVPMAESARLRLVRDFAAYFQTIHPLVDREVFMDIALSNLDYDWRTEKYSDVK